MNGPKLPVSKEPASQRPPAVGKEVKIFHDTSTLLERQRTIEHKQFTDLKPSMEYHKPNTEADNSPNPSPPPAIQWGQSLQCLLDDLQGVDLFREFLKQEGHETRSLDFRFGALGLQKADSRDREKLKKMINVLYEKMVRRIPSISQSVKDEIKSKLSSGVGIDVDIFNAAREEVEAYMLKNTYPNFLKSDLYIQHLQPTKARDYPNNQLPTLHEGKELNMSLSKKIARFGSKMLQKAPIGKTSAEAQAAYLKSPSAPYHTSYAQFCLPSARDSELQSLSSGVQTDDTMSQTDTSLSDYSTSKSKLKRQQKSKMNSNPNPIVMNKDCFSQENFIPRTQLPVAEHIANTAATEPATFAKILTERLLRVQEENNKDTKNKEKVIEKLKAIEANDCFKTGASPGQKFPLYAPEEDNNQAILDNHISMVFEETPTRSPACATPPAAKALEGCSRIAPPVRCSVDSNLPHDLSSGSRSMRGGQRSPFFGSLGGRVRQDPETRSNDSGALTDWMSEDNLPQYHRNSEFENVSYDNHLRRAREKLKNKKLSTLTGSSSSFFDSGVSSTACEPVVQPSHQKVTTWLEAKRSAALEVENERQGRTSPVPSRSGSSRRACSSLRSGCQDMSGPSPWGPSQLVVQDSSSLTTQDLLDVKRILEVEARGGKMGKSKCMYSARSCHDAVRGKVSSRACDTVEDGISHRKQSRKSSSGDTGASTNEMTIIGYSFGRDSVPYKTKLSGKNITLRQFKTHLNKRGNYRYFFKRLNDDFGTKVVLDEVTDDYEILPLWEGKVFCVIEAMDDGALMNDD